MDQARELDQLRRLAYSRSGTEEDRLRLADLEASIEAGSSSPQVVLSNEPVDEPVGGAAPDHSQIEDSATDGLPIRRSRWLAAGMGAAVGAALATSITLAFVAASAPPAEPEGVTVSALSVFDREPLGVDDPANLGFPLESLYLSPDGSTPDEVEDLALRWVGRAAGNDAYAVRWHEGEEYTICLIVVSAEEGSGAACGPEADFVAHGIRMSALGVDVMWGPSGTEVWVSTFR